MICFLAASAATATSYYISPSGSDNNAGTQAQPWATYPQAARVVQAGDTVLVQPGVYSFAANANSGPYCAFTTLGTPNAPITFRALGPVTNKVEFFVEAPYYCFDGFTWDGCAAVFISGPMGGSHPGPGGHHVVVTNCIGQYATGAPQTMFGTDVPLASQGNVPESAPSYNTFINCTCRCLTNFYVFNLHGVGNLAQGNMIDTIASSWAFALTGASNNIIRLNTVTNEIQGPAGLHANVIQIMGDSGFWSVSNLFERNYIVGGNGYQWMDASMQQGGSPPGTIVPTNNALWGLTLQNNILEDANMQCSIDIPNVVFYNNTFRRCSSQIVYGFYDPNFWMPVDTSGKLYWECRGWSTGGKAINNAFIDSYNYAVTAFQCGPFRASLTNGAGTVVGGLNVYGNSGLWVWGTYSNLVGTVTNGVLSNGTVDRYTLNSTNFGAGTIYLFIPNYDPAYYNLGCDLNNQLLHLRLTTDSTTNVAQSTITAMWSLPAEATNILTSSDYNYQGQVTEPHGIQSGNLNLAATNAWPSSLCAPLSGSVLIDAGANLSSLSVTNDFSGAARPQGGGFDIGALEYVGQSSGVAPGIMAQPQSLTVTSGASATFSVTAAGTAPLAYQWSLNGISLPSATASAYTDANAQAGDAGAYSVLVANPYGSITSVPATLTVLAPMPVPPSIAAQPQSATANVGAVATFSVVATGTAPLAYQWSFNSVATPGATASTIAVSNVQTNYAGAYSVLVSNSAGVALSANALLTVVSAADAGPQCYVSITGNDTTGDGTATNPWRTIAYAITQATNGSTVNIGPGDYAESVQTSQYVGGTAGNPIHFVSYPAHQAILRSFRLMSPYIILDGLVFSNYCGVNNLDSCTTRIEPSASNCTITNCIYTSLTWVEASDFQFATNGGNQIISASSDFHARGFVPGAQVYLGACGVPGLYYTNHDTLWVVSAVDTHTLWVTNAAAASFQNDTGSNYWAAILPGSGTTGIPALGQVASGGVASNTVFRGNVIRDWIGPGLVLKGDGNIVENNLFTNIISYNVIDFLGSNLLIRSNVFRHGPNLLYFTAEEAGQLTHPAGSGWFDFFMAQINSEPNTYFPVNTNEVFCWNYMEGFDNALGAVYDHGLPDTYGVAFTNNIFVGIGSFFSLGQTSAKWQNNIMYRCGVMSDIPLTMGGQLGDPLQTNYLVTGNLFVDCGPKNRDDTGLYSEYLITMTNFTVDYNMAAGPETRGYAAKIGDTEANGVNGGDPVFLNVNDPFGPDGNPFSARGGFHVLPNSPAMRLGGGALGAYQVTTNVPVAHFRLLSPTNWVEPTGEAYDPTWIAKTPGTRYQLERAWNTVPMIGTNVTAAFDATFSISAINGVTTNLGISQYVWTIDGVNVTNSIPFQTNTFSTGGTKAVVLTVYNTAGNSASTTNYYRLGGGIQDRPPGPTGLHFIGFGP